MCFSHFVLLRVSVTSTLEVSCTIVETKTNWILGYPYTQKQVKSVNIALSTTVHASGFPQNTLSVQLATHDISVSPDPGGWATCIICP